MSLLKLLSAAKSLDGSKSAPSPYRMRAANLLPRFGSSKNPFESLPKSEPVKPEAKAAPTPVTAPAKTDSLFDDFKPQAVADLVLPAPAPKAAKPAATQKINFEPKPVAAAPESKRDIRGAISKWIKKFNPSALLPKRQPGATPRPKGARATVQGELSLEKVRVLRNELNDSDLEVITAKPAKISTAGSMLPAVPQPRMTTWNRLTSRVTGVVETQIQ